MTAIEKEAALTRADLSNEILEKIGLTYAESKEIVDSFFEEIVSTLERGEEVKLSGFGVFQLRDKVARPGRNPKTQEEKLIEARRVVTFRPSTKFKKLIETA